MDAYCLDGLKMEEGVIYLRIAAARCAARFGCILPMLRDGSLSMTAVHVLRSHLTEQNHRELLAKAQHKSKRKLLQLLADEQPKPHVADRIRTLPERKGQSTPAAAAGDETVVSAGQGTDCTEEPAEQGARPGKGCVQAHAPRGSATTTGRTSSRTEPLGAKRYGVHFTATEELHNKLIEAQALLSHTPAGSNLVMVFERALDELLKTLRKRKYAETDAPRQPKAPTNESGRGDRAHIPAAVRRAVYERDGGRCTFVSPDGHRCQSSRRLQFHHIVPVGQGGATTVDGLTLHCQAHNLLAAERDYGADLMHQRMAQARSQTPERAAQPTVAQGGSSTDNSAESGQPVTPSPPALPSASVDEPPTCAARSIPASQAKAARRPTIPSRRSPERLEAPLPHRRRRGKEQQPDNIVLPGQLALPVQAACRGADEPSACTTPDERTRPAAEKAA